jgi:hypothetical protein
MNTDERFWIRELTISLQVEGIQGEGKNEGKR